MKLAPVSILMAALMAAALSATAVADGEEDDTLEWSWQAQPVEGASGKETDIVFSARIKPGWILYSSDFDAPEFGPRPAKIVVDPAAGHTAAGELQAIGAAGRTDRNFAGEYRYTYFSGTAELRQRVRHEQGSGTVTGVIHGQTCFEESGLCTLSRQPFSVDVL